MMDRGGDEYVPNAMGLPPSSSSSTVDGSSTVGLPPPNPYGTVPPPSNQYPSQSMNRHHMQMHGMGGGGGPSHMMNSANGSSTNQGPHPSIMSPHMQHMQMQNPYMNIPSQTPQSAPVPAPPPSAPAPKQKRTRKAKVDPNAVPPSSQSQSGMDPMQRMAAMSHNPMAYGQQQGGMGGGYPPGYPPQYRQPYGVPHPQMQMYGQGGQPSGGVPPPSQSRVMVPPPQSMYGGGYPHMPQPFPPYPPYPSQSMQRYDGMPPQGGPHPYYMENPYYPQQQHPAIRPNNHGSEVGWGGGGGGGSSNVMANPYAQGGGNHMGGDGQQQHNQDHINHSHIQMELMQCQQHLQRLYVQPRTPHIEQEIGRFEQRVQMLQMHAQQQQSSSSSSSVVSSQQTNNVPSGGNGSDSSIHQSSSLQQFAPPPGTQSSSSSSTSYPPSFPSSRIDNNQSQSSSSSHISSPPVSVTGNTNQIQVNIKPEQAGHTLISVYQMPPEGSGYPPHGIPPTQTTEEHPKASDSVPPEPIPSYSNTMPVDPYGISSRQQQSQVVVPSSSSTVSSIDMRDVPSTSSAIETPDTKTTVIPHVKNEMNDNHVQQIVPQVDLVAPSTSHIISPIPMDAPRDSSTSSQLSPPSLTTINNSHSLPDDDTTQEMISSKQDASVSNENDNEDDEEEERRRKEEELMDEPPRAPCRIDENREEEEEEIERREEMMMNEEKNEENQENQEDDEGQEEEEKKVELIEKEEDIDDEDTTPALTNGDTSHIKEPSPSPIESPIKVKEEVKVDDVSIDTIEKISKKKKKIKNLDSIPSTSTMDNTPIDIGLSASIPSISSIKMEDGDTREASIESSSNSMSLGEEITNGGNKKKGSRTPKAAKSSITKKRKQSIEEDEDDDDFIFESKKNNKKKKVVHEPKEEFPMDLIEKRRSGRAKVTVQRFADEEKDMNHAKEMYRELDMLEEASGPLTNDLDFIPLIVTENTVVEKILNMREKDDREEFLAKYKGRAYIHCEWKTLEELEENDKRVGAKVKRFKAKKNAQWMDMDDEDFNQDFTIIERVVALDKDEDEDIALVKWKALPYDECTWERINIVPQDKIDKWRSRQVIDPFKAKERSRPEPHEWKKIDGTTKWKDGNTLREYQFEGVSWLLYCYHNRINCILADEMGLGKTVQTITFLSKVWQCGIHGPFLIVVPLSTVHNWSREFETWTDMNVIIYHGSANSRKLLQQFEFNYYEPNEDDPNAKLFRPNLLKLDAIITTFEVVVTDVDILKHIPFRVCVIDEAHRLKNRNCKLLTGGLGSFKMEHSVLLTGTPLQNNIEELFSLLNFLHPAQFPSSQAFNEQFGLCQTDEQVQKLQELLKPMMLRRLKEDVEKTLQPKQETIVEVQLSDTQKKYYRAILERNFSHLCKGTNAPALMNAMMELRKCCNHPFLIQGAEEQIVSEFKLLNPQWNDEHLQTRSLVLASGKMVLIEKLLPKLKQDGHKVLIFSQMVKVLDLIEEFLVSQQYTFERIDGNVRGDVRQAAIDRFSKPDSDRFVFLLCTRAGGLGINLTAADTVIIFDSDWNPQNDLQAQARCHRIGQKKTVKVYRLVTANTYEREMFEKASLKLGLDKAVLQSTHALRDQGSQLSKKDVEELLKKGAYGSILDDDTEGSKFNEEDIETILQRRTTTITLEAGVKGSTFSKATFNASHNEDIDIDDPNFWSKWAQKANVDSERALASGERQLIVSEPRQRKKRFEPTEGDGGEESDNSSDSGMGRRKKKEKGTKRKKGDDDTDYVTYRPDELAFSKTEYFKVEKLLGSWTWGRWLKMKENGDMEVTEMDMEHMSRTLLLHCLREYRGDDRTKEFVWKLIHPSGHKMIRLGGKNGHLTEGWAALPEYNPPNFALDTSFQRHVHRHANKLLTKIEQLHHLENEMIGSAKGAINSGKNHKDITISVPIVNEPICNGWDQDCDKSLIIGVYRHGLENVEVLPTDDKLVFTSKKDVLNAWPTPTDLQMRARRLISLSQRNANDPSYDRQRWPRRDELEFMRVLRSYGMMDKAGEGATIDWTAYRRLSPILEKKTDEELQEQLYCVLAMCTRVQGGDLSPLDVKRAMSVDTLTQKRAQKLMNRLHLTRKIHALGRDNLEVINPLLKLCSTEAMPSGWTAAHDKDLLLAVHEFGIENISTTLLNRPLFQKIIRPTEKTLLRRVMEICCTCENGKWNGTASIETIEDSDDEKKKVDAARIVAANNSRRSKQNSSNDKEKMRQLLQQSMLAKQLEEMPLTLIMQSMLQASMTGQGGAQAAAAQQAQAALLQSLFSLPSTSSGGLGSSLSTIDDAVNLCKKEAEKQALAAAALMSQAQERQATNQMTIHMLTAANVAPETRIPMINTKTKERLPLDQSPIFKGLESWLNSHPDYTLDLTNPNVSSGSSTTKDKPSTSSSGIRSTPSGTPGPSSGSSTPRPSNTTINKSSTPNTKLEPGEIPKASTSTASTSNASSLLDPPVPVCNRLTNTLLPTNEWPTLSKLIGWLDGHPEANIHSSGVAIALPVMDAGHLDRIGMDTVSSTSSSNAAAVAAAKSLEQQQLQMQLLLQQSILSNPALLMAMGGAMPSTSKQEEAVLQQALQEQLIVSMLAQSAAAAQSNPLALQQLNDPQILLALAQLQAAQAQASSSTRTSSSSRISSINNQSTSKPSTSSSSSSASKPKMSSKLAAVVEKLANNQS